MYILYLCLLHVYTHGGSVLTQKWSPKQYYNNLSTSLSLCILLHTNHAVCKSSVFQHVILLNSAVLTEEDHLAVVCGESAVVNIVSGSAQSGTNRNNGNCAG